MSALSSRNRENNHYGEYVVIALLLRELVDVLSIYLCLLTQPFPLQCVQGTSPQVRIYFWVTIYYKYNECIYISVFSQLPFCHRLARQYHSKQYNHSTTNTTL